MREHVRYRNDRRALAQRLRVWFAEQMILLFSMLETVYCFGYQLTISLDVEIPQLWISCSHLQGGWNHDQVSNCACELFLMAGKGSSLAQEIGDFGRVEQKMGPKAMP
jgi:hypothetical protein